MFTRGAYSAFIFSKHSSFDLIMSQNFLKGVTERDIMTGVAVLAYRGSGMFGNVRKKVGGCAIPAGTPPLTWNRGEYLRVAGIHSDG